MQILRDSLENLIKYILRLTVSVLILNSNIKTTESGLQNLLY